MNADASEIVSTARRVLGLQLGALVLVAAGFFLVKGHWEALSALYGGLISVVVAFLLSRGVLRAANAAPHDHKKSMLILYLSAAQRFLLVAVLFGVGLAMLKLQPLPTVAGFIAAQLVYLVAMRGGS
ncbi:MAG: ATP synthase subunit I [Pseudomonadota bacterium]